MKFGMGWRPDKPDFRDWGMKGYYWMPYDYLASNDLSDDFWQISKVGQT
jgi:hypothetical protein